MKKQDQKVVAPFDSIAVQLNAMKAAARERDMIQELIEPSEQHCEQCQLENAITICLELASVRDHMLCNPTFPLTQEEGEALIEERNEFIIHACEAVIRMYAAEEVH